MIHINTYYYNTIQKIKNDITILEKNKATSIKFNDYKRCKEIKNEIAKLIKLIEFNMKCNQEINNRDNNDNNYLYANIKYKNTNNKNFYLNNYHKINSHL